MNKHLTVGGYLLFILLHFVNYSQSQFPNRLNCPAVPDRASHNVIVRCQNSYNGEANCSSPLAPGSLARFNCPKYFVVKNGTQFPRQNKEIYCSIAGKWSDFQNFMRFSCVSECGKYVEGKNSFGNEVQPPSWQVTILKNRRRESCDGSLIPSLIGNTSVILTSRDCVTSSNGTKLSPKDIRISITRQDSVREFLVKTVFVPADPKSNIAILNLTTPVVLSDDVLPICLPFGPTAGVGVQDLKPETIGIILGTETAKTEVSILSPEKCLQGFGYSPSDTEFCTIKVDEGSQAACPRSDGPFLLLQGSNSTRIKHFRAFGVQSGNLRVNSCQLGIIFTKITSFQNWISEVLRKISGIEEPAASSPCESRTCGPHSVCRRNLNKEVSCVCEDGWTRDSKNPYAECKPVIGIEKVNQVKETQPPRNRSSVTPKPSKIIPEVTTCPPLYNDETDGFKIDCSYNNRGVDCSRLRQAIGTTAVYTCKTFYNPPTVGSSLANRACQPNGQWTNLRRDFSCTLTCGANEFLSSVDNHRKGVSKIPAGKWPWVVALYHEDPPGSQRFKFTCGGTLISQTAVLTAAQCVTLRTSTRHRNVTTLRIVMGKYYRDFEERHIFAQERYVKDIHVHGDYRPYSLDNDIAVLFMDKPVKITEGVHPICLPTIRDAVPGIDELGTMAGWGRKEDGKFQMEIDEIKIPIVANETCLGADELLMDIVRPPKNFCAGYLNESLPTPCDEDEGNGLYFQEVQHPRAWKVLGITSAVLKMPDGHCRRNIFSVFTNVTVFRHWLDAILDKDVSRV